VLYQCAAWEQPVILFCPGWGSNWGYFCFSFIFARSTIELQRLPKFKLSQLL
jgi:hypothetical protein